MSFVLKVLNKIKNTYGLKLVYHSVLYFLKY